MPAVRSPARILITGANGFVAVWVVKAFLDQGFAVRATVRAESKATYLRSLFDEYGSKFEIVIVEDITKDGAFDEAVKGVDAIAHTASPFHMKTVEPEEIIGPAVHGTISILTSALQHGSTVKRVVILSSTVAILVPSTPGKPRVFSEADWNEWGIAQVKEKGRDADNWAKYFASKTLSEKAAWEFWKIHESEVGWDLVCLNPPFVYGPCLHEVDKPENLNESTRDWFETVVKGTKNAETVANTGATYVDVRDLAQAHVLAITKQEASGERVIIYAGPFKWQDFITIAHRLFPQIPSGSISYDPEKAVHLIQFSTEKQRKILGIKYRTMEETTKDILQDCVERGWLSP